MGRQEKPLDPDAGPVARFAHELRRLRHRAGGPTYAAMASRAGYSVATLSRAAAGEQLPSLPVVRAYATACGADPAEWEERWHAVSAELAASQREEDDAPAPYRGLARFEPGDQELFFGRDELSAELAALAHEHRVIAVLGPSGSGKSSLLRAGLIPRLRQPSRTDAPGPPPAAVRILTPGSGPLDGHRAAFVPADGEGDTWVIVDQFEEVFTLCTDAARQLAFIETVLTARRAGSRLRVVLGVRADFYARCLEHPELAAVIRTAALPVGPMTEAELRQVIIKPAALHGLVVERALTARLLNDITAEHSALPLLSHVLLETWRRRHARTLTLEAYERAGGLQGSMAQTAEAAFARLDAERQRTARGILLRLITPGEGAPDTRRPTTRAELEDTGHEAGEVLDHLGRSRLLTLDHERVDLAHEALIGGWPRLARWIEEDRERLRLHRRLTEAAGQWDTSGRDAGALLRGTPLTTAAQTFAAPEHRRTLTGVESDFLERSMTARRRRTRLRRATTAALSVLVALSVLGTALAVQQHRAKNEQRAQNSARRTVTVADSLRTSSPTLAGRLSIAAWRLARTRESQAALLAALGQAAEPDFTALSRNPETSHASLSPDGTTLRVQQGEKVREWDVTTRKKESAYTLRGIPMTYGLVDPRLEEVMSPHPGLATWSPDGRQAADVAPGGAGIAVWDVRTGARRTLPSRRTDTLRQIALSNEGRRVALATHDRTELWDLPSRRLVLTLPVGRAGDGAVAVSRDGRLLARCGKGDRVELRRIPDGRILPLVPLDVQEIPRPSCRQGTLQFSPDGRTLSVLRDTDVERIDTVTGRTLDQLVQGGLTEVSFSPDSRFVAGVTNDELLLWRNTRAPHDPVHAPDDETGLPVLKMSVPRDKPYAVRVDVAAGVIRYLGAAGRTVRTVNARSVLSAAWDDRSGEAVRFSPDGNTIAVPRTTGRDLSFDVRETGHGRRLLGTTPKADFRPGGVVRATASFSADGRFFAFTAARMTLGATEPGDTSPVRVWDVQARRPVANLALARGQEPPDSLAVVNSAGAPVVYALVSGSVWDLTHGRQLTRFSEGTSATGIAAHPHLPLLALDDGTVLRLPRGRVLHGRSERDFSQVMAYSPSGDLRATADRTGRVLLHDGTTNSPQGVLSDGLSDGPDGNPLPVTALAFSPDGRTLAVGNPVGRIRLWDLPSRTTLGAPLPTGGDSVRGLAFSPDGRTLYAQGAHTRLRSYPLAPERLATELCARFGSLTRTEWTTYIPDQPYRPTC
ncbi:helix-turn-helix domain-containing protein [Streptomyces sp. NPDC000987]|uniref:nSTAND1 domain-containing NTPase n=1 Tax=Streptomyces sp. NPDC000987 TaxID=3154374 RepID=UPI00331A4DB0